MNNENDNLCCCCFPRTPALVLIGITALLELLLSLSMGLNFFVIFFQVLILVMLGFAAFSPYKRRYLNCASLLYTTGAVFTFVFLIIFGLFFHFSNQYASSCKQTKDLYTQLASGRIERPRNSRFRNSDRDAANAISGEERIISPESGDSLLVEDPKKEYIDVPKET